MIWFDLLFRHVWLAQGGPLTQARLIRVPIEGEPQTISRWLKGLYVDQGAENSHYLLWHLDSREKGTSRERRVTVMAEKQKQKMGGHPVPEAKSAAHHLESWEISGTLIIVHPSFPDKLESVSIICNQKNTIQYVWQYIKLVVWSKLVGFVFKRNSCLFSQLEEVSNVDLTFGS